MSPARLSIKSYICNRFVRIQLFFFYQNTAGVIIRTFYPYSCHRFLWFHKKIQSFVFFYRMDYSAFHGKQKTFFPDTLSGKIVHQPQGKRHSHLNHMGLLLPLSLGNIEFGCYHTLEAADSSG